MPASPSLLEGSDVEEEQAAPSNDHLARLAEEVAKRLNQMSGYGGSAGGGIAPEVQPRQTTASSSSHVPTLQDRGLYHAADAMREMYDMGDAPSCNVCGAIMVRNGSCYRCMSCGSTSGCS
jgi:ribonucleoside-diphosphate reductase alpha chain